MTDPEETMAARAAAALAVPLAAALGCRLLDGADPAAGAWLEVDGLSDTGAGGAHASALAVLGELAGYLAVAPTLSPEEHAVTHASSWQLVSGAPAGSRVEARGHLDRRGRAVAFVSVAVSVGDQLVARAQLTKSVVGRG